MVDAVFLPPGDEHQLTQMMAGRKLVVEVGAFTGLMSEVILRSMDPAGHLWMIDTFLGTSGGACTQISRIEQLRELFDRLRSWEGRFSIIIGRSEHQIEFKNRFLDCVFLDGDHDYLSVSRDICHWLP